MATPSTPDDSKSIRVTGDVHARLLRLSEGLNGASMNDTIAWLLSPSMVRISLTPEQRERWTASAKANGMDLGTFAMARVEGALQLGADPGALRRIHDMVHALTKAAGIIPPARPDTNRSVINPL